MANNKYAVLLSGSIGLRVVIVTSSVNAVSILRQQNLSSIETSRMVYISIQLYVLTFWFELFFVYSLLACCLKLKLDISAHPGNINT